MNIILFGPYGSGKGTQGAILAKKYDLLAFDTGSEIRFHIKEGTDIGKKVQEIVARGDLVPNEVVMDIVSSFIERSGKTDGFLFDGLPRTQIQADSFDALLADKAMNAFRVLINIPQELSLERQMFRNAQLVEKRIDGSESVAKKRIQVYQEETLPMIQHYIDQQSIIEIDGTQSVEEVTRAIEEAIVV